MGQIDVSRYKWDHSGYPSIYNSLLASLLKILSSIRETTGHNRVFDLGCGNGAVAKVLSDHGYEVVGVDPSREGISLARSSYPDLDIHVGSSDDDLVQEYGQFPIVVSMEVVEHVYHPRDFVSCIFKLLEPGGYAIISTPFHGYWKNLLLALSGTMDRHFTALWECGHIKFFSINTFRRLLSETGFDTEPQMIRVGRIPPLARSMIAVARKPPEGMAPASVRRDR